MQCLWMKFEIQEFRIGSTNLNMNNENKSIYGNCFYLKNSWVTQWEIMDNNSFAIRKNECYQ